MWLIMETTSSLPTVHHLLNNAKATVVSVMIVLLTLGITLSVLSNTDTDSLQHPKLSKMPFQDILFSVSLDHSKHFKSFLLFTYFLFFSSRVLQ